MPPPRVDVPFEVDPAWDLRVRAGASAALARAGASGLRCSVAGRALEVPVAAGATLLEGCATGLAELGAAVDVYGGAGGGLDAAAFVGAWKGSVRSVRRAPGGEAAAKLEVRFVWDPAAAAQAVAEAERQDAPEGKAGEEEGDGVAREEGRDGGDGGAGGGSPTAAGPAGASSPPAAAGPAGASSSARAASRPAPPKRGRRDELVESDESLVPLTRAQLLAVARDGAIRRALRAPSLRAHVRAVDSSPPEAREAALQAHAAADPAFREFADALLERVLPAPIDSRDLWGEKRAVAAPDPEARAQAILKRELERVARENEAY